MSDPMPFVDPSQVVARCDLTINDVQATAARIVHRDIWQDHPDARALVEKELRFAVAEEIVKKLAPPVFEVRTDTLRAEAPITRAEALRLAEAHTKALADLASRLKAAGENYAVMEARRAADAGQTLVEKLQSHEGRLPVHPGEEHTP